MSRVKNKVQVAIQVRSKLSNPDDLTEFSIVLSISDKVAADSVLINTGQGEFDKLKRIVTWKLSQLPKGESFMVSVRGRLLDDTDPDEELSFPVMLRCRSRDQISSVQFQAVEASGYPASVTSNVFANSYRIIHRLK